MSSALRHFITDRRGHVAVAQSPNGPMLAWSTPALATRTSAGSEAPPAYRARRGACLAGRSGGARRRQPVPTYARRRDVAGAGVINAAQRARSQVVTETVLPALGFQGG